MAAVTYLGAILGVDDDRLLNAAAGQSIVTVAHQDMPASSVTADHGDAHEARLNGIKVLVPYAMGSTQAIVVAHSESGAGYYLLDLDKSGVVITALESVSRNQHCLLELSDATALFLGPKCDIPLLDFLELYRLASDAFAVGLMGAMVDMSLRYVTDRVQFGRPIGSFQAIQHRCADMAVRHSGAQSLLYSTAWLLQTGRPAERSLLMCHSYCRDAAGVVVGNAHQVHGAIGFTHEHSLHFLTRRLWSWRDEFGNETEWNQLTGRHMAKAGSARYWAEITAA
jgi:acyl-CoA dehydrogenase